jgi:hypothetical protein
MNAWDKCAEAVRGYLKECSGREMWPRLDDVKRIFAENFAPILNGGGLDPKEPQQSDELSYLKESMSRIAKEFGITTPLILISMAENNEETYTDILIKYIRKEREKGDSERDQLRKELEHTKGWLHKKCPRIGGCMLTFSDSCGCVSKHGTDLSPEEAMALAKDTADSLQSQLTALTAENAALKEKVEVFKQEATHTFGEYKKLEEELTRLRSKFQWIPVSERMPTEEDANSDGCVWMWDQDEEVFPAHPIQEIHWSNVGPSKGKLALWMSPISLPALPTPETEEQRSRKAFEEHCAKHFPSGIALTMKEEFWIIWQAARQS